MTTITMNGKDYDVQYGYKPVLQSKLLSRLAKNETSGEGVEVLENILTFLPDMLLVGLQINHKNEFGYDEINSDKYNKAYNKVLDMVAHYADEEDGDCIVLYGKLNEELEKNSFLSKQLAAERASAQSGKEMDENTEN